MEVRLGAGGVGGGDQRPPSRESSRSTAPPSALLTRLLEEDRRQGSWHHIGTVEGTTGALRSSEVRGGTATLRGLLGSPPGNPEQKCIKAVAWGMEAS